MRKKIYSRIGGLKRPDYRSGAVVSGYVLCKLIVPMLVSILVASCATAPKVKSEADDNTAAARRFFSSIGIGDFALASFKRQMEAQSVGKPAGYVEMMQRVMGDITARDFEDMAAEVYSRHLNEKVLNELADFTESPTGSKFFKAVFKSVLEGKPENMQSELMSQLNADELTEIAKFAMGDAFKAMQAAMPAINREMAEQGRKLSEEKLKTYLDKK